MQAIIIATASTEKLWPLTKSTPSPLISIGNRPVMEIVLEQLARAGFKKIIVCLHKMAGSIELYFGDGSRWGVSLEYVLTRESWGSAGVLGWAKSLITDTFIVMPADAIIDLDINAAFEHHQQNEYAVTVVLHNNKYRADRMIALEEANNPEGSAASFLSEQWCSETGAYIFEKEALTSIPVRKIFDISTHLLPAISKAGMRVGAYVTDGYWNPLDSFCEFQDAQKTLLYSLRQEKPLDGEKFLTNYSQLAGKEIKSGIWVGRNTIIHPSAQLIPPLLLGENTRIGQDVVLGPDVVVGAGTIVSDRVSIQSSTIFDHTYIGQLLHIENRLVDKNLIIDTNSSDHIYITDNFLLNQTPRSIPLTFLTRIVGIVLAAGFLLFTIPISLAVGLYSWLAFGKVFESKTCLRGKVAQSGSNKPTENVFRLLNFRTRTTTGNSTRVSRWFERLELTRLPELLSVLNGDLQLVGTKSLAPEEMSELEVIGQEGEDELIPGFTGLWYIQTNPCDGLDEILVTNVYYHATQSLKQDLQILLRTPRAWIKHIQHPGSRVFSMREG